MQSKHGTIFRYRILILQLTMSSQIVGKRIEKEVLFNLDGQPVDQDVKPLKFAATPQPKLVAKPSTNQSKQPSKEAKLKSQRDQLKAERTKHLTSTKPKPPSAPTQKKQVSHQQTTFKADTKGKPKSSSPSPYASKSHSRSPSKQPSIHTGLKKSPNHSVLKSPPKSPKGQGANYREPRTFKPISQQFPNLMGILFQKKEFTEDLDGEDDSSGYSDDDEDQGHEEGNHEIDESEYEDQKLPILPKPERNPKIEKDVQNIVATNNKKFIQHKKAESQLERDKKQQLREQREKMKAYGKQQILRAHTMSECYEQKYAWGVNQAKLKEESTKFEKIREAKEEQQKLKQQLQPKQANQEIKLEELFPESQGRVSKYRQIWDQEAQMASDKRQFALSDKRQFSLSAKKVRSNSPKKRICNQKKDNQAVENEAFKAKIEQNASEILKSMGVQKQKKKQEQIIKKHKIDYIEREARQIIRSIKKKPFQPRAEFNSNFAGPQRRQPATSRSRSQMLDVTGVKEMFEEAEQDHILKVEMKELVPFQQKVKNGKVISERQYKEFKDDQKAKRTKIDKMKTNLKDKPKTIKLKNPEALTEEERRIKAQMGQMIDVPGQVAQAQITQLKKHALHVAEKTTIVQPGFQEFIFAEAELPQFQEDYEVEERMGFREQVEQEIKEQILKHKKKRIPAQQNVLTPKKAEQPKKPQPRAKPVFRSQSKLKHHPVESVYHDLGDVCILEEDMYQAQHSNWHIPEKAMSDSSSEEKENREFVQKSGFYKPILANQNSGKVSTQKPHSKSVQPKAKKKVYFREPADGESGGEYLTENKEKLMRIIEQQKVRGQATSEEDSDTAFMLQYSSQIWLPTDPVRRDVFVMNSKELMSLGQINI